MQLTETQIDDRLVQLGFGERCRPAYAPDTEIFIPRGVVLYARTDSVRIQVQLPDDAQDRAYIGARAIASLTKAFADAGNVTVDPELTGPAYACAA